jgi:serine/threonine-protein kinase
MSDDASDVEVARVLESYLAALEAGQPADPRRLPEEYPELADRLRACLRVLRVADQAVQDVRSSQGVTQGSRAGLSEPSTLCFGAGQSPQVRLRDLDDERMPLLKTRSPEMPSLSGASLGRYQLHGELARGGMGAILKGRDADLGRDLAIKVLLESHERNPEVVRRFIEEAQIGGQLQHPGVVPVYELGTFPDRRPYFAMKLVTGRTLGSLLQDRPDLAHNLPRFLAIFEQVCQTMSYAHARGVIHRDLKPSNIMVGSFGEVQVMDWGLAKVLPQGGIADEPGTQPVPATLVTTLRSGSTGRGSESQAGSVLGTPAYMAPEQARGEVERVDERADVFGLGAILCEILTGQPPFVAASREEIRARAAGGDLADARRRLESCGADAELIDLARVCLEPERDRRPRNVGEVARRITAYVTSVQERLRRTELARVEAQTRAEEAVARAALERSKRRRTLALAASVLVASGVAGASWLGIAMENARRSAIATGAIAEANRLHELATRGEFIDIPRLAEAIAAVERGSAALGVGGAARLRREVAALLDGLKREQRDAIRDRDMLARLAEIRGSRSDDDLGLSVADSDYARAFAEFGIPVDALSASESAGRIRARPHAVALELAAALDDWEIVRHGAGIKQERPNRLLTCARLADDDPYRNAIRTTLSSDEPQVARKNLKNLAADEKVVADLPASSADLLGISLSELGEADLAVRVLRRARQRFPQDVWINLDLAAALENLSPPNLDEAISYRTAAQSVRPGSAHSLGHALQVVGRDEEAIAVFRGLAQMNANDGWHCLCLGRALIETGSITDGKHTLSRAIDLLRQKLRLYPGDAGSHHDLGSALFEFRQLDTAIREFREAVRLKPESPHAHFGLGNALKADGKADAAIAEFREALRIKPNFSRARNNLAVALAEQGKWKDAMGEFREALRLQPDSADAHNNLGSVLIGLGNVEEAIVEYGEALRLKPDFAKAHTNLGNALRAQGKVREAVAHDREAVRLKPDDYVAHSNLGLALCDQGKMEEAIEQFRGALRLKPDYAKAHTSLGAALHIQGKVREAMAHYRESVRLKPDDPVAHSNLGVALKDQGKLEEAIEQFRGALRLKPDYPDAHYNLGVVLRDQGKMEEAIDQFREALRLRPDSPEAHYALGGVLRDLGRLDEAVAECREALRLKPDYAEASITLGAALFDQGKPAEAATEFHAALRLKPSSPDAHHNLGEALSAQGRAEESIIEYREALRLKPGFALCHIHLGRALAQVGRYGESLAAYRRGHDLGSKEPNWRLPSAEWVHRGERMVELENKLPAILAGQVKPAGTAEAVIAARMCYSKKLFGASSALWAEAFKSQPSLADEMKAQNRYNAACPAALAGSGQGKDNPPPDESTKARWRQQAIDWLKADLSAWSKVLESGPPPARQSIAQTFLHWKVDSDLAGLRDATAIAKLPDAEQNACRWLWAEVDALLAKAQSKDRP